MDLLPLVSSFGIIALAEMGDKTQLSVIALAAEYDAPLMVFVEVMLALALITGIGVALGTVISRLIPMRYVKIGSSLIFVIFGVLFLFGATTGTKLL
jgi:putative Ca2+/H+ antiporter (TMEM165/GDT1 family)